MTSFPNRRGEAELAASPLVVGVIPARLHSQRLPRKMLRAIAGRPLLAWTYQAAMACPQLHRLVIAVDSEEVAALCREHEWPWMMTSPDLPSGTDRLNAISQHIPGDIYVNIQGDEPLIGPIHVEALLAPFSNSAVDVTTLKVPCSPADVDNPNVVKVVSAVDGRALYFSRAGIPYLRSQEDQVPYFRHLGLYAYRRSALHRFAALAPSQLELAEKLEQLRLLENGLSIYVNDVDVDTVGVDTENDLHQVEAILQQRSGTSRG